MRIGLDSPNSLSWVPPSTPDDSVKLPFQPPALQDPDHLGTWPIPDYRVSVIANFAKEKLSPPAHGTDITQEEEKNYKSCKKS